MATLAFAAHLLTICGLLRQFFASVIYSGPSAESSLLFKPVTTFRFDTTTNTWTETPVPRVNHSLASLKIITFNVLFDLYDAERIYTTERNELLFALLRRADADLVGLQEVTPKFLANLMQQPWVRQHYFISETADLPNASLNTYGQVILSKLPMKFYLHEFSKYKRVIVGEVALNGRVVFFPCLHLTSNEKRNANSAEKRMKQIQTIFDRTSPPLGYLGDDGSDCIIFGDFNFDDDSIIRSDFEDVWAKLHPDEPGLTIDPTVNPIAAITCTSKHRYDRIYIRGSNWAAEKVSVIGNAPTQVQLSNGDSFNLFPSDHYGLMSTIRFVTNEELELSKLLSDLAMIETPEGEIKRIAALATLRRIFNQWLAANGLGEMNLEVLPIGSYSLGVHSPGGDLDVLCVSPIQANKFFAELPALLLKDSEKQVVSDALIPIMKTKINGIQVDILYSHIPVSFANQSAKSVLASLDELTLRKLDDQSVLSLNGHKDSELLLKVLPDLPKFRLLLRFIKLWSSRRGIYGNAMGFLGGFAWTVLCAHVCQRFPQASIIDLIRNFFDYYAAFNWKASYVTLDVTPKITYKMDKRDLLTVVTFFRPCKNAARNITKSTLTVIKQEFARCSTIFKHKVIPWSLVLRSSEFFTTYKSYIKIVASAVSEEEFFRWKGWLESRLVALLYKLDITGVLAHPCWRSFPNKDSPYPYSAFFFVGLKKFTKEETTPAAGTTEGDAGKPGEKLDFTNCVREFEDLINAWPQKSAGMDLRITHSKQEKLPEVVFQQSVENFVEGESYSSEEEAIITPVEPEPLQDDDQPQVGGGAAAAAAAAPQPDAAQAPQRAKKSKGAAQEEASKKQRMRTSWDVYNRLKWDPSLRENTWIVGHEDRFDGVIEATLEEFTLAEIPWHRVRYFKKDGEIVWDRRARIDKIFGPQD